MSELFEQLKPHLDKINAYSSALTLFSWDSETCAPKDSSDYTSRVVGELSSEQFKANTDPLLKELLMKLKEDDSLSVNEKAIVRELWKTLEEMEKIPPDEYREYAELQAVAAQIWQKAKREDDYASFSPTLEKIISYNKKFAGYKAKDGQKLYDVLLDEYEEGFSVELLDEFFSQLKEEIVPLLKKVVEKNSEIDDSFLHQNYDINKQKEFNRFLAEYIGFDFDRGVMAESEHPFTTNLHNHDVRITTHYYENMPESAIFSTIHEGGHALYEFGVADELTQTPVGTGASMGMHESQSRFMENVIGRSEAFWEPIYEKLVSFFPKQLKEVPLKDFIKAINKVQPDLIRTEADELTYSLHILIRYELEKQIMEEDIDLSELPKLWADKYEEYLGVRPKNDAEGVLQDVHWAQGMFGYFPSYALGNAFAAQIYEHMKKKLDVDAVLRSGDISPIVKYLGENIHRYGMVKKSRELLKDTTGEDFTAKYYIQYLKDKFTRIYDL